MVAKSILQLHSSRRQVELSILDTMRSKLSLDSSGLLKCTVQLLKNYATGYMVVNPTDHHIRDCKTAWSGLGLRVAAYHREPHGCHLMLQVARASESHKAAM